MMGDFGFGHMGYGWIFWLALIFAGIVLFRRSAWGCGLGRGGHNHGAMEASPLEILKQRYAKGEISKEEFERMKKDLADRN